MLLTDSGPNLDILCQNCSLNPTPCYECAECPLQVELCYCSCLRLLVSQMRANRSSGLVQVQDVLHLVWVLSQTAAGDNLRLHVRCFQRTYDVKTTGKYLLNNIFISTHRSSQDGCLLQNGEEQQEH